MQYHCEATSIEGFIQQLACCYLPHGYCFHVSGWVPERKDPRVVDAKLLAKYGIAISRQSRARRKLQGLPNFHYLRHGQLFVLLATHGHGQHEFFAEEGERIRDLRHLPFHGWGYSVTYRPGDFLRKSHPDEPPRVDDAWHTRVQIGRETYRNLKSHFLEISLRRSVEQLGREFYTVPFEPYAPVRQQMLNILRQVNEVRKRAGMGLLPWSVLRYRRHIVKPFEPVGWKDVA
jgi:hypothetical protein